MDLEERWLDFCRHLGLEGTDQWLVLKSGYSEPERAYHNLGHIADCLAQLDALALPEPEATALEAAIWFHDLVYDTRAKDNEERSAEAALSFLRPTTMAAEVAELIRATKHHNPAETGFAIILCDIDLSILGRDPQSYAGYAKAIRKEYGWVSDEDYASGRTAVLRNFLDRDHIFATSEFRIRYEQQARANLQGELDVLARKGEG